jgi:hypothetical protein
MTVSTRDGAVDRGARIIDLDEAVGTITRLCGGQSPPHTPFFFIVGAGISAPIIKTASQIVEDLGAKVREAGLEVKDPSTTDPVVRYQQYLDTALPSRRERRKYFEELIRNKPISSANFRLALLLLGGKVGTSSSPNFDDFLSRALRLFARHHIVCDHPSPPSASRTIPRDPDRPRPRHLLVLYARQRST